MLRVWLQDWASAGGARIGLAVVLGLSSLIVVNLLAAVASGDTGSHASDAAIDSGRDLIWASRANVARPGALSGSVQPELLGTRPASPISGTVFLPLLLQDHWTPGPLSYGVQIHTVDAESAQRASQMGAKWARTSLHWSSIEPVNVTPEDYQWPASLDEKFRLLSDGGIETIVTILGNPDWAATYPGGPLDRLGHDASEMVEFVQAAVERYSAPPYNVKYWEFYNEQDNGDEFYAQIGWGYFGNTPELYVDLLVALYPAIKAVDPEAQVVFGGIAYDNWTTQQPEPGPMVEEFLDGVLAYGQEQYPGLDYFDLMNFHYYSLWDYLWGDITGKGAAIREKLESYGVDKPITCTEAGMWSWPPDDPGGDPLGAEQQSRYVPQLYARSLAAELVPIIWYELVDDSRLGIYKHGLLTTDGDPKPAYYAYQTLARQLGNTAYVRTLSPGETGSDQIEAYEFVSEGGAETVLVAWTNDLTEHTLVLDAAQVVRVEKWGGRTIIYDRDDGSEDGQVQVILEPSPVYVRFRLGPGR